MRTPSSPQSRRVLHVVRSVAPECFVMVTQNRPLSTASPLSKCACGRCAGRQVIDILTPYDTLKVVEHSLKGLRYDRQGLRAAAAKADRGRDREWTPLLPWGHAIRLLNTCSGRQLALSRGHVREVSARGPLFDQVSFVGPGLPTTTPTAFVADRGNSQGLEAVKQVLGAPNSSSPP